jgi:hypothetical protein
MRCNFVTIDRVATNIKRPRCWNHSFQQFSHKADKGSESHTTDAKPGLKRAIAMEKIKTYESCKANMKAINLTIEENHILHIKGR